ncbi:MAG: hypothetical protein V3R58_01340, partial [candidate division NC10 bacterium]
ESFQVLQPGVAGLRIPQDKHSQVAKSFPTHQAGVGEATVATYRVIVNVGLPGWFVAIGLRVMAKQPDLRGILCLFMATFSVVT